MKKEILQSGVVRVIPSEKKVPCIVCDIIEITGTIPHEINNAGQPYSMCLQHKEWCIEK